MQRRRERGDVELAGGADEAHLQLPGAAALAHDEVAQPRAPVRPRRGALGAVVLVLLAAAPRAQALLAAPALGDAAREVAGLGGEQAVLDRQDPLPAGGGVKAAHELAGVGLGIAEGVLELVAVAPGFDGRDDLLQLEALQLAQPPQRLADLVVLDLELALVGEHLPGHAGVIGARRDSLGAGVEQLEGARVRVAALAPVHDRAHAIAGNGPGDEHDVAAIPPARDALAAEGERADRQLQLLAERGPRAHIVYG